MDPLQTAAETGERPYDFDLAPPPELLTLAEVAAKLRVVRSTVHELIARGDLRSLTLGRRRFITTDELKRFIAARLDAEAEGRPA
jgi:excisionase family DNA binding protein